jgi:hypothetical protein
MVSRYSACLRRLVLAVQLQKDGDEQRENIALCIFLAVTVVEPFMNLFFRILIEESEHQAHRARILDDLNRRISLDKKIRSWPELLFGRQWDLSSGTGKAFADLKEKRNALMHFTSTHESISEIPGILIHGLADTEVFDSLQSCDADVALKVAEDSICDILQLSGQTEKEQLGGLHLWTGKVPSSFL